MKTFVLTKKQYDLSQKSENPRSCSQSKYLARPSLDKGLFCQTKYKKKKKKLMVLNNENMEIIVLQIYSESIIPVLNILPCLFVSKHIGFKPLTH